MGKSGKPKPSKGRLRQCRNACSIAVQSKKKYRSMARKFSCEKGILNALKRFTANFETKVGRSKAALKSQSQQVKLFYAKYDELQSRVFKTPLRCTEKPDPDDVKPRRIIGFTANLRRTIQANVSPYEDFESPSEVQKWNAMSSMIMCTHWQGRGSSCVVSAMLNWLSLFLRRYKLSLVVSTLAEALTEKVGSDAGGFRVSDVIAHLNQVVQESTKVYVIDQKNNYFCIKFVVELVRLITGEDAVTEFARSGRARKGLFLIRTKTSKLGHVLAAQGNRSPCFFDTVQSGPTDFKVVHRDKVTTVFCLEIGCMKLRPVTYGPSNANDTVWTDVPCNRPPVLRCGAE